MWELWKYWTKITRTAAGIRNPRRRSRDLQIGERKRENQPEREYLEIENKEQFRILLDVGYDSDHTGVPLLS